MLFLLDVVYIEVKVPQFFELFSNHTFQIFRTVKQQQRPGISCKTYHSKKLTFCFGINFSTSAWSFVCICSNYIQSFSVSRQNAARLKNDASVHLLYASLLFASNKMVLIAIYLSTFAVHIRNLFPEKTLFVFSYLVYRI